MTKDERSIFIERMESLGDHWEDDDVKRCYGKMSLEDATASRVNDLSFLANVMLTTAECLNKNKD